MDIPKQEERGALTEVTQVVQPPDAEGSALEQTLAYSSATGHWLHPPLVAAFEGLLLFTTSVRCSCTTSSHATQPVLGFLETNAAQKRCCHPSSWYGSWAAILFAEQRPWPHTAKTKAYSIQYRFIVKFYRRRAPYPYRTEWSLGKLWKLSVGTLKARELSRKAGSHSFLCTSISHATEDEQLCSVCTPAPVQLLQRRTHPDDEPRSLTQQLFFIYYKEVAD